MQTVYMNSVQMMAATREGRTFYDQNGTFLLRGDEPRKILIDDYLPDEGIFAEDTPEAEQCRHRKRLRVAMKVRTDEFKELMGVA
jgi:hypothetical protein